MPFHKHALPNGLTLVGETTPDALAVGVGFFVRTGSRDEAPAECGLSHFLEHMAFKGTPRRTPWDVNRDFDQIGADYNAYTSEENTVYHAAVLPEYLPQAVDILADILRPSLRTEDFDTEKKVILEEIAKYEDQPDSVAFEHARRHFFGEHPLGNSVLGTTSSVSALTAEQMRAYFDRRYVAPNVLVAVAGNFDWGRLVALVGERCGDWPSRAAPRGHLCEAAGKGGTRVVNRGGTAQEYVYGISAGPPAESPLRYSAEVLALALGDDTGSRLYWELVDPGHAEGADTSYHENQAAGSFHTTFSCDPEAVEANLGRLRRVLAAVQRDGLTDGEVSQVKTKLVSRLVRANESTAWRMMALGSSWTYLNRFYDVDEELRAFDAVTTASIREVLDRYPIDRPATLAFGPLATVDGVSATSSS
jgi:predicted Zn-dependent peptidase